MAIESVRTQDYPDWEIVVSDNASDEDVLAEIESLGDSRIRGYRQPHLVPVTDNWNAALTRATGDYFIMLGDDDALMPNALAGLAALIQKWRRPKAVYVQALQYAYPGVMPGRAAPFVQVGYNEFLRGRQEPFAIEKSTALRMVRGAMAFRILYGYNMQHFVISAELVARLKSKGPFFQSPYPDYYAANATLLAADPVIATPETFTLIGISPKSFGYYYLNEREQDGTQFLQNVAEPDIVERVRGQLLPGTNMNDSWLCAMETLARNFPDEVGSALKYSGYRRQQYYALIRSGRYRTAIISMRWWELPIYAAAAIVFVALRLLPRSVRRPVSGRLASLLFSAPPPFDACQRTVAYRDILEAARGETRAP